MELPEGTEGQLQTEEQALPESTGPDLETLLGQLNTFVDKSRPDYAENIARLKSHSVMAGVAGNIAETMKRAEDEQKRLADMEDAARAKEQELLDLAENDPEAFAAKFRTEKEAERARREIEDLRSNEQQRIAGLIGQAAGRDLPNLTPVELREIADALSGKTASDEVIPAYNAAIVRIAGRRHAADLLEKELPARMAAEREAWEAEHNASRLRTSAPSLGVRASAAPSDEPDFRTDPMGYIKWAESGGRSRLARGA